MAVAEGPHGELVLRRETVDRSRGGALHEVELRPGHRPGDVEHHQDARALADVVPGPLDRREHLWGRRSDEDRGARGHDPVRERKLRSTPAILVAEAGFPESRLRLGSLEVGEEARSGFALRAVDPGRVEHHVGVVRDERPFLR
jgi:hypothetical protein